MEKMGFLPDLAMEALTSWTECRPKMVRFLRKNGILKEALLLADKKAREETMERVRHGEAPAQAKDAALMTYIYLPPEKDVPILPTDQMPFEQPEITTRRKRRTAY